MTQLKVISFEIPRASSRKRVKSYVYIPHDHEIRERDFVCCVRFLDESGYENSIPVPGFHFSESLSAYYVYLETTRNSHGLHELPLVDLPEFATSVKFDIVKWGKKSTVDISDTRLLYLDVVSDYNGFVVRNASLIKNITSEVAND